MATTPESFVDALNSAFGKQTTQRAAHAKGTAHEWSSDEARQAGRKGGMVSRGGRGKLPAGE